MGGQVLGRLSHHLAATVCAVVLAGCASGGGGSGGSSGGTGGGTSGGTGGGTTPSVTTPYAGTLGSNTTPVHAAVAATPTLQSTFLTPTRFPLKQSTIQISNSGWSPDAATTIGGATLTVGGASNQLLLDVPALGITNQVVTNSGAGQIQLNNNAANSLLFAVGALPYVANGVWYWQSSTQAVLAQFVTGLVTPSTFMPHTGSATYSGTNNVLGFALKATDVAALTGDASLTANFATGSVTGSLKKMVSTDTNKVTSTWNDIALTGNIASGTGNFTGTTSTSATPGTSFAVKTSASGTINGDFYGPNVEDVGAVWTIGDGTTAAFGTFVIAAPVSGGSGGSGGTTTLTSLAIGNPTAPGFGASPIAAVLAATNSPTFDSTTSNYPVGDFPALHTSLLGKPTGVVGSSPTASATVTDSGTTGDCPHASSCSSKYKISIPELNYTAEGTILSDLSKRNGTIIGGLTYGLSYVSFGLWAATSYSTYGVNNVYAFGYQTPVSGMPTSGTATYSGSADAIVVVPDATKGASTASVTGVATMNANFATGAVTGTLSSMTVQATSTPWNSVSVTANITPGSNAFTGTTAATSSATGTYAMKSTATGQVTGGFYGPTANEVGAVWTLSNGDGTAAAIGTVGGRKQ